MRTTNTGDVERQLVMADRERLEQIVHVGVARGLVARDPDAVVVAAQVEPAIDRAGEDLGLLVGIEIDPQGVEVRPGPHAGNL